jgi:hypothetical protein
MITVDFGKPLHISLKPVHGVTNGPLCNESRINLSEQFREIGVPYVRLHDTDNPDSRYLVDISRIFPCFNADENDPQNYFFTKTDRLLKAIVDTGAKIIYRLGESIDPSIEARYTRPPADFKKWARICVQIIRHYNDGWADGFHFNIEYWEIWNEPDSAGTADSPMWRDGTLDQVCELYETAAVMIKTYDKNLKIGGMAFSGYNTAVCKFVEYCSDHKLPLDFISFHWYYRYVDALSEIAYLFDELLEKYGYQKSERIFDEWNYLGHEEVYEEIKDNLWAAWGNPKLSRDISTYQQNRVGAAFVLASMIQMNNIPIDIATYYDAQTLSRFCGLFDVFGNTYKTFYAFKAYNELYKSGLDRVEAVCSEEGIYVIANHTMVLLSNYQGKSSYYDVFFKGLGSGQKKVETYIINDQFNLELVKTEFYYGEDVIQKCFSEKYTVLMVRISHDS